jgi:phage repressor protein C with HTH and peptisase S24 domain
VKNITNKNTAPSLELQIGERIKESRERKNWTQHDLAGRTALSQSAISKIEKGKMLDAPVLRTLAEVLGVTVDWIVGAARSETLPVIGYVSAGETDVHYDDQGYPPGAGFDEIGRPAKVKDPHAYALRVRGDSMEPVYKDGDTVILDTTKPVHDKDEAIVRLRGKTYFKIFRSTLGRVTLQSFNREHPEIPCGPNDIQFAHKVVLIEPADRAEAAAQDSQIREVTADELYRHTVKGLQRERRGKTALPGASEETKEQSRPQRPRAPRENLPHAAPAQRLSSAKRRNKE